MSPENSPSGRRFPPVLLVFLIFPILGLIAAVAVALSGGAAAPTATVAVTPPAITLPPQATEVQLNGQPAPEFALRTLDQTTARLSDYRGRVVFLNFWATWCVPCQRELPAFEQFTKAHGDSGPVVLAVNLGQTYDQAKAYLDERKISGFPVLLDVNFEASDLYGIGPIPVTFVIDAQGVIRFRKFGEMKPDDMRAYLDALEKPASGA